MWLFLLCPLSSFILEEREVPSPQRSKWYFRLRSSWECGWARTWLQGPVEDWRCSDGSALRRWPGRIRYSTRRLLDANSQWYDFYSGCSHSWSLVNSLSAAAFCRWEAYLQVYPTKTACFPFCYETSFLSPSECCLPLKNLFSVTSFTWVRIQYARPKPWNLDHISPVTTYSADCIFTRKDMERWSVFCLHFSAWMAISIKPKPWNNLHVLQITENASYF